MPSDRTTVTEIGTGLGMLGLTDINDAISARSPVMHSLSPEMWDRLAQLRAGGVYDADFHAAWENGRAFLSAGTGLRGRLPQIVEWKGTGRAPGDEVAPIDLRVDHVYLVSCKYLSKILFNVAPTHVFEGLLIGQNRPGRASREPRPGAGDWYAEVASSEYQDLYEAVRTAVRNGHGPESPRRAVGANARTRAGETARVSEDAQALPGLEATPSSADTGSGANGTVTAAGAAESLDDLPAQAIDLSSTQRDALGDWLRAGWPPRAKERYVRLSDAVARASVRRWKTALESDGAAGEAMLWRLLRIGSAPYFVLGSSAERSLRLRIATSWDWRQRYQLVSLELEAQKGGQPRVGWHAFVRDRTSREISETQGHIEVRWSHGRFGGRPEAKGYLDTPHHHVPGYFAL